MGTRHEVYANPAALHARLVCGRHVNLFEQRVRYARYAHPGIRVMLALCWMYLPVFERKTKKTWGWICEGDLEIFHI
jgi:hypothetical protein